MPRETIASVKEDLKSETKRFLRIIEEKNDAINRQADLLLTRQARIDELLHANSEFQMQTRAARAEVNRLQAALSDASRVIAALGQRSEG